jgi:hypothetical protein
VVWLRDEETAAKARKLTVWKQLNSTDEEATTPQLKTLTGYSPSLGLPA